MIHPEVTVAMACASALAAVLAAASVRRARAAGDLDASAALTFGVGSLIVLPPVLVAIAGGVERRLDAFRELQAIFPDWYADASQLAKLLVIALALGLVIDRLSARRLPLHAAGLLALCLWAVAQLAAGLHGGLQVTLSGFVLLACLAAATVLPRGRGACFGAGLFGVTLAIGCGAMAVLRSDVAFIVPCEGACGGLGFTGLLPNENLLGVTLAATIPFAYLGFRGRTRYWMVLYLAGMTVATGSRTAILAAVIGAVALAIVRPRLDAERTPAWRGAVAWAVLAGAVAASVYVISRDWDPSALTNRPELWSIASEHIARSPWFGYGPEAWAGLVATSEIPTAAERSTHNQWLDVLFVAGVAGAVLFVAMLAAALRAAGRARPGIVLALAVILMIGATEGGWPIGDADHLSFSLVALILAGPVVAQAAPAAARSRFERRVPAAAQRASLP